MNLLVPNLGSTSLKYQILEMPSEKVLGRGRFERVRDYAEAIGQIGAGGVRVDAVAFKAVHAGPQYRGTFIIDDGVLQALAEFLPAAPAHNAIYLAAIRAFRESLPDIPLVAAFETEFHATMPDRARLYGVPAEWRAEGVRQVRIPWRIAPIRGRALRRAAGPPDPPGELPPGWQFVDLRHRPRPVHRHHHGILAAIRPGERHPPWRSGRVRACFS